MSIDVARNELRRSYPKHSYAVPVAVASGAVFAALNLAACSSSDQNAATSGTGATTGASGGFGNTSSGGAPSSGGSLPVASGGATAGGGIGAGGELTTGGATGSGGVPVTSSGGSSDGGSTGAGGTNDGGADSGASTGGTAAVTCPATSELKPGETNETIDVGGTMRSYILHVPASYTGAAPVPLVLDFHPILSTGSFERGNSGYANLSDQDGFVVAFPNGIDNAWNVGPCCTQSRTVDDLGFAKGLVAKLKSQGCIDPKRVYATGYSMGGGMSHYLACNAADVFAAVAPSAFDLLQDSEEPCHPSRPITEITFRGTADPIVPYAGGASNPPNGLAVTIHFLGAVGTFQKWAMLDQCTDMPSAADASGCQTYSQCAQGVQVTLCTTQGGSHVTGDPNIGWAMLKKHPMP